MVDHRVISSSYHLLLGSPPGRETNDNSVTRHSMTRRNRAFQYVSHFLPTLGLEVTQTTKLTTERLDVLGRHWTMRCVLHNRRTPARSLSHLPLNLEFMKLPCIVLEKRQANAASSQRPHLPFASFVHRRPLAHVLDYRMGAKVGASAGIGVPRAAQPVLRRSARIPYGRSPVALVAVWTRIHRSRGEPTRNHIQAGADRA
jgi:hypothetical protein